jgi:hypothetical protein
MVILIGCKETEQISFIEQNKTLSLKSCQILGIKCVSIIPKEFVKRFLDKIESINLNKIVKNNNHIILRIEDYQ